MQIKLSWKCYGVAMKKRSVQGYVTKICE